MLNLLGGVMGQNSSHQRKATAASPWIQKIASFSINFLVESIFKNNFNILVAILQ